ncbi:DUF1697 domain-containing protein [Paenibacillus sp. FSL H8-0537]|uniref:DUF1697 domain-containing protein n=1 Tax=Paenibacillus sp. FSL H8-0537 TaxID=2921399 RepID=UPI0031012251
MAIYIALLRGINVGGHKIIKMQDLQRMFEQLGVQQVKTYIQSGNVLFESDAPADQLRQQIQQEIMAVFGFDVPVVIRTNTELAAIVASSPFDADQLQAGENIYVALLADTPTEEGKQRLLACSSEVDDYRLHDSEVYIYCRQSVRKSMFSNNLLEKKLGVSATSRNWQTMNKLLSLTASMEERLNGE